MRKPTKKEEKKHPKLIAKQRRRINHGENKMKNIEARITEIREISLQILNILDTIDKLWASYAYTYIEAMANGAVEERAKQYGESLQRAYESQLLYAIDNLKNWRGTDAAHYRTVLKQYLLYFKDKQDTGKLRENICPLWQAIRGIGD